MLAHNVSIVNIGAEMPLTVVLHLAAALAALALGAAGGTSGRTAAS